MSSYWHQCGWMFVVFVNKSPVSYSGHSGNHSTDQTTHFVHICIQFMSQINKISFSTHYYDLNNLYHSTDFELISSFQIM